MRNKKKIEILTHLLANLPKINYKDKNEFMEKVEMNIRVIFGEDSYQLKKFTSSPFGLQIVSNLTTNSDFVRNWIEYDKPTIQNMLKAFLGELELKEDSEREIKKVEVDSYSNQIFIVHGHDNEMKNDISRTLETLGLEPIILHEQPNESRTIIQKIQDYSQVGCAVVLLSPDDRGKKADEHRFSLRARQNVIFELGYFIGRLGLNRVLILYKKVETFEFPTDISGILYTPYDEAGAWKMRVVGELQTIGYEIDANKLI